MDTIALHQGGFDNAVASLGTSLTTEHAQLLSRYFKEIVISYDGDGAGVAAAQRAIPLLEKAGVTSFHVTLADHGALEDTIPPARHPAFGQEGCFLPLCDRVRALTKLPLCGVGGLTDPAFVEEQLRTGRINCVAMSRQLIADPAWPQKVAQGRADTIRRCIRCNKACLGGMLAHQGVHCIYERKDAS